MDEERTSDDVGLFRGESVAGGVKEILVPSEDVYLGAFREEGFLPRRGSRQVRTSFEGAEGKERTVVWYPTPPYPPVTAMTFPVRSGTSWAVHCAAGGMASRRIWRSIVRRR